MLIDAPGCLIQAELICQYTLNPNNQVVFSQTALDWFDLNKDSGHEGQTQLAYWVSNLWVVVNRYYKLCKATCDLMKENIL